MTDEASIGTVTTASTVSNALSTTSETLTVATHTSTVSDIDVSEDFSKWKLDGKSRFILPDLLCKNRVDEKMTIETHASDAIVWNIVNLCSDSSFPTLSPSLQQRIKSLTWLKHFKKYLNKTIAGEVRAKYCNMANHNKWSLLRKNGDSFLSFDDLVKRTKYCVGKEVRDVFENFLSYCKLSLIQRLPVLEF